jgi:hypothetical protein
LFEGIGRISGLDAQRAEISSIPQAGEEFSKRVSSFKGQSARPVRPANQILDQEEFVKQGRRQKKTVLIDFPTLL